QGLSDELSGVADLARSKHRPSGRDESAGIARGQGVLVGAPDGAQAHHRHWETGGNAMEGPKHGACVTIWFISYYKIVKCGHSVVLDSRIDRAKSFELK